MHLASIKFKKHGYIIEVPLSLQSKTSDMIFKGVEYGTTKSH